jgi:hypothetical protein
MGTIVCNPTGFSRIVIFSKEIKFNADSDISHVLDPLTEWRRSQVGGSDRRLHIHADNARPHSAKKVTEFLACNGMKSAPHPTFSPDLEPYDFDLFGQIKGSLAGASSQEFDRLLQALM